MLELVLPMVLILLILDNCPSVQETEKLWEANKMNGCVRKRSVKLAQKFTAQFVFTEFYSYQRMI